MNTNQNANQYNASKESNGRAKTRVLAINFGGIGDEILFLPTLSSIRAAVPNCDLTLLLEPRSRSVEQITNLIDKTVTFDIKKRPLYMSDLLQLVGTLREHPYDLVISSGGSKPVAILLFISGIPVRVGYDSGELARKLLTAPVRLNKQQYAGGMYHDLATGLGASAKEPQDCIPTIELRDDSVQRMATWLKQGTTFNTRAKRFLLHPGTSRLAIEKGIYKTWSPANWAALIEMLTRIEDAEVLLAGGPDDEAIIQDICSRLATQNISLPHFRNCYGVTKSLADLAAMTHLSDVLVCVDSAPMHVGVGLRKNLVAMFGPTDEKLLLPQHKHFTALHGPVSIDSPRLHERGVQLQPDIVFQSVLDQLQGSKTQESYRAQVR